MVSRSSIQSQTWLVFLIFVSLSSCIALGRRRYGSVEQTLFEDRFCIWWKQLNSHVYKRELCTGRKTCSRDRIILRRLCLLCKESPVPFLGNTRTSSNCWECVVHETDCDSGCSYECRPLDWSCTWNYVITRRQSWLKEMGYLAFLKWVFLLIELINPTELELESFSMLYFDSETLEIAILFTFLPIVWSPHFSWKILVSLREVLHIINKMLFNESQSWISASILQAGSAHLCNLSQSILATADGTSGTKDYICSD